MLLRTTRGTLAEIVGPAGLPLDRLSRRIGFHHSAKAQMEVLDPEIRQMLAAFARGVTDGARLGSQKPAHEFALLRARPTEYEALDLLALSKYVAFGLSTWTAKLTRLILLRQDGPEALQALDANYAQWLPASRPVAAPAGPALDRLGQDLALLASMVGTGGGSNGWAVASSCTATGRPLLSNDPHLTPSIPPPWYLAHIRTPGWALAGAFLIGSPAVGAGHNGVAAWGATAGLADNLDLYLEELGDDGRTVRDGDQFMFCDFRSESIRIKGKEPVEEEVLVTARGPIISDVLEGELGAISMRATWMAPEPLRGLLQVYRATSFDDFRQAMAHWPAASFGLVYADTLDTIGWQLAGLVPQRGEAWGTLPLPGWLRETQWKPEPIPFEEMPYSANPETGFVATANNKPVRDGDGPYLGNDWGEGYRLARIVELLGSRNDWDLGAMQQMQMDQVSIPWREMREIVLSAAIETAEGREAHDLLANWDGIVTADSPAAAVYEFFLAGMLRRMAEARVPNSVSWALGQGFHPVLLRSHFGNYSLSHLVRLLREEPDGWFQGSWPEQVAGALAEAVRQLKRECGPSPAAWAWGRVRPLTLSHPLGSRPLLDQVFNRGPFPQGGDSQTLAQTGRLFRDLKANPPTMANLRMVLDVGNWDENLFVLAGGQSGNPLSPHYDDQLALWKRGEGLIIAWSEEAVQRIRHHTLRLSPS
jgi:penicillin amidase